MICSGTVAYSKYSMLSTVTVTLSEVRELGGDEY